MTHPIYEIGVNQSFHGIASPPCLAYKLTLTPLFDTITIPKIIKKLDPKSCRGVSEKRVSSVNI